VTEEKKKLLDRISAEVDRDLKFLGKTLRLGIYGTVFCFGCLPSSLLYCWADPRWFYFLASAVYPLCGVLNLRAWLKARSRIWHLKNYRKSMLLAANSNTETMLEHHADQAMAALMALR
jgi:hypothetical protein